MDHNKAYEVIGSLSASIDQATVELGRIDTWGPFAQLHLDSARRSLKQAQETYQQFRKSQGWDTQGAK